MGRFTLLKDLDLAVLDLAIFISRARQGLIYILLIQFD